MAVLRFKRGAIILDIGVRCDIKPRQNDIFIGFRSSKDGYEGPLGDGRLGGADGRLETISFLRVCSTSRVK